MTTKRAFFQPRGYQPDVFNLHRLTWTMPSVADVTGSEKSPPGGDTAPTMVTLPSREGEPRHRTVGGRKLLREKQEGAGFKLNSTVISFSVSNFATGWCFSSQGRAFKPGSLFAPPPGPPPHASRTLVERREARAEVRGVAAVRRHLGEAAGDLAQRLSRRGAG